MKPLESRDLQGLRDLQPQGWKDISITYGFYLSRRYCFPWKYEVDGRILGIGARIDFRYSCWIASVIVHPEYRKRGIGRRIVSHLMDEKKEREPETTFSLIATDLGYPLYRDLGFEEETEYLFYNPPEDSPGELPLSPALTPYRPSQEAAVLALDREASAEERGPLLLDHLSDAYLYSRGNRLLGYAMPSLGDGMIIARDEEAGLDLLGFGMKRFARIILPRENFKGREFLEGHGYRANKSARRMVYGPPLPWRPEFLFNRIGGNLG